MTEPVAAQHDQASLPPDWAALVLPRRGNAVRIPVAAAPDAVAVVGKRIAAARERIEAALDRPETDPDLARAALAHLDGATGPGAADVGVADAEAVSHGPANSGAAGSNAANASAAAAEASGLDAALRGADFDGPNPVGAGVVVTMLRYTEAYGDALFRNGEGRAERCLELFEHLHVSFGLPFAIAATIEDFGTDVRWYHDKDQGPDRLPTVVPGTSSPLNWMLLGEQGRLLAHLRACVAEASAAEYDRILAAVRDRRDTPPKRLAAALILPDQTEWVTEVCAERASDYGDYTIDPLLWSSLGDPAQADLLGPKRFARTGVRRHVLAELIAAMGPGALPPLAAALGRKGFDFKQRSLLYEALALVPSDQAADILVRNGNEPEVLNGLRRAALHDPTRYARALVRVEDFAGADTVRLCGALRQPEISLESVLKGLEDAERAALETLFADAGPPTADLDSLPEELAAPRWADRKRRRATAPITGLTAPDDLAIVWAPGEHEWALNLEPEFDSWEPDAYWADPSETGSSFADRLWGRLARGGAAVADAVTARMKDAPKHSPAIVPIRSAAAAALAADWFTRLKSARAHAVAWFDRHGEHAVPYLVPGALGGDKRERAAGEAALRYLGLTIGPDAVLRAAEPFGAEAVAALRDLLTIHPHVPLAGPPPKPGAWADPAMLPPVLLRRSTTEGDIARPAAGSLGAMCSETASPAAASPDAAQPEAVRSETAPPEAALPDAAVRHLITALSLWSPRLPFPGVEVYAAHCDHDSLRRFSLALFELWLRSEAPSKDSWAVEQLGRFGDDATAAVLGPLTAAWPGRSQADRALLGVEVLGHIGTDTAFTHLREIAVADRARAVSARARVLAERLAAARGLDTEAYADRLVPDHGVADPATLTFDYGPRRFHVHFDHLLNPHIADETGKPRKTLPKPGVRDDQTAAKNSAARYRRLVKTVTAAAEAQIERLRAAMLTGRTWTPADFAVLLEHPLISPFAARLVWFSGTGFRVAEDGGFADVHDRELALTGPVRVAHPALLGRDTAAWTEILRDYEVLQPFDQLDRPAHAFTDEELATGRLARFEGATATFEALGEAIGWTHRFRSPSDGLDRAWRLERALPGGLLLAETDVELDGFNPDRTARHTLTSVRLTENRNRHPRHLRPLPGRRLDPVTAAELLGGLHALTT